MPVYDFHVAVCEGIVLGNLPFADVLRYSGLIYQDAEQRTENNETTVFRMTLNQNGDMALYSNDYAYGCCENETYDKFSPKIHRFKLKKACH